MDIPARADATLRGIGLMVLAVSLFSLLDATAKWMGGSMRSVEVAWLRYATSVAVLCIILGVWRDLSPFRTTRPGQQFVRGLAMLGSSVFNFWALQYLQLAEANAIMFAGPLLTTALAGPVLGEAVGIRRWAAVVVGFLGVLVVLRPGLGAMHAAFALVFAAMSCGVVYTLMTRRMHRTETSGNMLMLSALVGAVVLAPVAPGAVAALEGWGYLLAVMLGVFGALGHYALVVAHRIANASTLAPFAYAQMPMMILLGYLLFDQLPDLWVLVGTAIIGASGLYILHRERVRRQVVAPTHPPMR